MELSEKLTPFDCFIQIIDGKAEIIIDGKANYLNPGEGIVIPAHRLHTINADERFKIWASGGSCSAKEHCSITPMRI